MILKPQDIVILLKLIVREKGDWSYAILAKELFMSVSEVHSGLRRAAEARLFNPGNRSVFKNALDEYLISWR